MHSWTVKSEEFIEYEEKILLEGNIVRGADVWTKDSSECEMFVHCNGLFNYIFMLSITGKNMLI